MPYKVRLSDSRGFGVSRDDLNFQKTRLVALIDGDGMIFRPERISNGIEGGKATAGDLARQIQDHVHTCYNHDVQSLQTWIWIFFNKRGLLGALMREVDGVRITHHTFEQFIQGFNLSSRSHLLDCGTLKEAADDKIRGKTTYY